jgi:hypothetical protein
MNNTTELSIITNIKNEKEKNEKTKLINELKEYHNAMPSYALIKITKRGFKFKSNDIMEILQKGYSEIERCIDMFDISKSSRSFTDFYYDHLIMLYRNEYGRLYFS